MQNALYMSPLISRKPLRDHAYQEILDLVHRGDLPPGSKVRDTSLASRLGISRTPIREALIRLSREGVLEADMGRGFSVCRLDPREMRETGGILSALEVLALQTSSDLPTERLAQLGALDQELATTRSNVERIVTLEEEWHRTLLLDCPNRRLRDMIADLWQVPRRYMRAYLREAGRVSLSTQHHSRIIEALRRNDRHAAAERLARHWERGIEEIGSWMER
jgi:DNA-binding GntR family transcriptional regulator